MYTLTVGSAVLCTIAGGVRTDGKIAVAFSIKLPYVPGSNTNWESGRVEIGEIGSPLTAPCRTIEVEAMRALLSFLGAAAESFEGSENSDSFPADVTEWSAANADSIEYAQLELGEP